MEIQQLDILLRLVIAHILADFIFQSTPLKRDKVFSKHFLLHLFTIGVLIYLMLPGWTNIYGPIAIMLTHGLIELVVFRLWKNNSFAMLIDQVIQITVLVIFWLIITDNTMASVWYSIGATFYKTSTLIVIAAYLAISFPAGALMGHLTKRWQNEIMALGSDSLKDAGKWIGIIERTLVLTFILMKQWAAIGFLLGAKSVLRFGELKDGTQQKKTEYILIGTFLSFLLSIAIGIFVLFYLEKYGV